MQLYLSPTSPFARKIRVALLEKGLGAKTEWIVLDPWGSPGELLAVNPLSQVPTLVLDDGTALVGSETVHDALESLHPVPPLLPEATPARMRALAVAGLAHGLIECIVQIVLEGRRPARQQNAATISRRRAAIERVTAAIAANFDRSTERFHRDAIDVACALAYLDFRLPDHDWRDAHPDLAVWLDWATERPSMRASAPPRKT